MAVRTPKILMSSAIALALAFSAGCGSDDDAPDVESAISSLDGSTGDSAPAEAPANSVAMSLVAALQAMPDGGQPTIVNLESVAATVAAGIVVSGIEDDDNDGTDDDAKATVEANEGDDKACMQHQNGVW